MTKSPAVRLSAADGMLRLLIDAAIYLRFPLLVLKFRRRLGYWPRPALPLRYNEKYLWRKLFDHNPRHVALTDKIARKSIVLRNWPDIRVPEIYWQGDKAEDIPDEILSRDCVVKANHGCNMNFLVKDGHVDRNDLVSRTRLWMGRTFGRSNREWAYSGIRRRLFVEQYLIADGRPVEKEYKFYVANGVSAFATMKVDRFLASVDDAVFDRAGQSKTVMIETGIIGSPKDRPEQWDRFVSAAERIGAGFDNVRIDLYEFRGEIWFSEFTFYPSAGYAWVDDIELMGDLNGRWDIRRAWFLTTQQHGWRGAYARWLRAAISPPTPD